MASRRVKLMSIATAGALGASAWFIYSLMAAQAQGALAQAPLNNQVQVPPAFIMAVDDSNSMTFERIFPGGDGRMQWNNDNSSFFKNNGSFYNVGEPCGSVDCYLYLYPHNGYASSYSPGRAIPPLDAFGFARSPSYNASYFNPSLTYEPWRKADGTYWPNATPTATRADPRDSSYGSSFSTAHNVVYDLTKNRAATSETFSMLKGMSIPNLSQRGMRYRWDNSWSTSARSINSNTSVAFDYFPATFYLPANDAAPAGYRTGDLYRPIVNNACGPGCSLRRYEIKPENYSDAASYNAAIQNFANWFQYHRNRLLAMVGAMSHSMQTVNNMNVGYFTINNRKNVTMRDVVTKRADLYEDFYKLQAGFLAFGSGGGTPNRDAVRHLGEQFKNNADAIAMSCQRNGGMLFTDGFTNSDTGPTNIGNIDGDMGAPFADSYSNSIADIAAYYYRDKADGGIAPLRSGGEFNDGKVPIPDACWLNKAAGTLDPNADPSLDCQPNLHMNFYGITLGALGAIYDVNEDATNDPFSTHPNWSLGGNPRDSDGPPTVDEIWHAAINTRGKFVNAKTPSDITLAMRSILGAVSAGASPSGSLALTGSRINTRTLDVQPSYEIRNEGTDWFSNLRAIKLKVDPSTWEVQEQQIWEASDRLASTSYSTRSAHTWFGNGDSISPFTSTNITFARLCDNPIPGMSRCPENGSLGSELGVTVAQAVNYLMGDTQNEVRNGGKLRNRSTLLGDVINSTPVVSAPTDDYGYRSLGTVGSVNYGATYNDYMTAKKSRNAMVYVGANDGMLHAFHGGINANGDVDSGNGGRELFAYVPRAVLGHMGNLLYPYVAADKNDQKFDHRYFVDGPISVSDAYYGGGWKTVLVGTTGAGGRSVFALNVSDPGGFGANSRLWEIDDQYADADVAASIGHVLGKPVVVPVREASGVAWKAIFGNGYNSKSGKAVLFVVDISTGAVRMIEAVETSAPSGTNGLGNIAVVDRWAPPVTDPTGGLTRNARDGFADTVYAADQKGAIWRFDLRDDAKEITEPLFTTQGHAESDGQYRQPIMGGLSVTAGRGGGVMILFGTGSFSFVGDSADKSVQTIYGVLDSGFSGTRTRGDLASRSSATSSDGNTRTVEPGGASSAAGWYLDLPAGERAVGYPKVASGVLFIPTYAPGIVDGCSTSGLNWLYGLNTRTGTAALSSVRFGSTSGDTQGPNVGAVALDTLGTAPVKDVGITVLSRAAPPNPGEAPPPDDGCWMRITVPGMEEEMFVPYPCGRQSWRQLQ